MCDFSFFFLYLPHSFIGNLDLNIQSSLIIRFTLNTTTQQSCATNPAMNELCTSDRENCPIMNTLENLHYVSAHLYGPTLTLFHHFFSDTTPKPVKLQIPFSRTPNRPANKTAVATNVTDELICPTERLAQFELFPISCNKNQDCEKVGKNSRCCKLFGSKRCHESFEKPLEDIEHERKLKFHSKCI
jgi:hypothetical protein